MQLGHAKTFAASGYEEEMRRLAKAYSRGDTSVAMAALTDVLLDDVVLLGSPARIQEGIDRFAQAGVQWITLGPQAVATESLARRAERVIATLAPR